MLATDGDRHAAALLAEQLEHAGKAEDTDTIEKVHGEAMTMFEGLLTALSKYFPDAENEDALPAISDDELYDLFSELTAACDELDMEKMEECGKRLREFSYPEEKQPLIESIIDAIASMDTDVIESLMKQY